jgi:hypothetical protein
MRGLIIATPIAVALWGGLIWAAYAVGAFDKLLGL